MTVRAGPPLLVADAEGFLGLPPALPRGGAIDLKAPPIGQVKWLYRKVGRDRSRVKVPGPEMLVARSPSSDLAWAARPRIHVTRLRHVSRPAERPLEGACLRPC